MLNKINAFPAKNILKILILTMGTSYDQVSFLLHLLAIIFQVRTWTLCPVFRVCDLTNTKLILIREQTGVKNKTTNQKNPAEISLPRHKTVHKQECKGVISANRNFSFNVKRHLYVAKKSCHNPKANCARTCTNTVNAVSWKIRLEYFIHVEKKIVPSVAVAQEITDAQAPCESFVFQSN